jgi:hypothetical protein
VLTQPGQAPATDQPGNAGTSVAVTRGENLGDSYREYRTQSAQADTLARMRAWREQQARPEPARPELAPAMQNAQNLRAGRALVESRSRPADSPDTLRGVVRGVAEPVPQLAAGMIEGAQNTIRLADDIVNYFAGTPGEPGPAGQIADAIPNPFSQPETTVGELARGAGRFLFGFWRGMAATRGLEAAGRAGRVARPVIAGALGDALAQNPNDPRLADMWKNMGLPENVLTDYLAADPTDGAMEGRLKNAIEGTLSGAVADATFKTVKLARDTWRARAQGGGTPPAAGPTLASTVPADPVRDWLIVGVPDAPLVSRDTPIPGRTAQSQSGTAAAQENARQATAMGEGENAAAGLAGAGARSVADAPGEVFINWGRINTAEDVQAAMRDMADAFKGDVDEARRGVQTNDVTRELAERLGLSVDDILNRRRGEPWNAETALAARRIYTASGEQLLAAAQRAAAPDASDVDQVAFRKMMAVHYAIQSEVLAARTETARALQSWSIPAEGGRVPTRAIEQMLEASGGAMASKAMASRLAILAQQNPGAVDAFVQKGWGARSVEAVQEVWINGLLSSPQTHIVNMASNTVVAFQQIYERGAARFVSDTVGSGEIAPGEASAMLYGLVTGLKDAFRLAGRTWRDGESGELGALLGKTDLPREGAISARNMGATEGSGLGNAIDFLGHSVVRVPGRALGAEDAFFKSINYRMELHAASLREARQNIAATGQPVTSDALSREVARIVANPPDHIRTAAADAALYATFNRQSGPIAQRLLALRNSESPNWNLAVTLVLPFIRTPANIISYSFERTPLAPIVGQWRDDIAAGGVRRDLALARMGTGSAIMAMAFDFADQGAISGNGPDDPGEREALTRQGWQPYSVKVGDRWVSYNRMDPFGFTMGFAADVADLLRRREVEPDEVDDIRELVAAGAITIANTVVNKTYMQGVSDFVLAASNPERYMEQFINNQAGSTVPAIAARGAQLTLEDGAPRETNSPAEAVMARIPGLAARLPPRRDLWGEPRTASSGFGTAFDTLTPFRTTQEVASPIDREIEQQGWNIQRLGKRVAFDGADVNLRDFPEAYDQLVRLAGNELPLPQFEGKGARDFLDAVVEGRSSYSALYKTLSDGKDGGKERWVRTVVTAYRDAAKRALLADPAFGEIAAIVEERRAERQQRRMPVMQ